MFFGKFQKAATTGISNKRRQELKACVLMTCSSFFKLCNDIDHHVLFDSSAPVELANIIHKLGRSIETLINGIRFVRSPVEIEYVKSRVKKYSIPVLNMTMKNLKVINHANKDNNSLYYIDDNVLVKFHNVSLKKLNIN